MDVELGQDHPDFPLGLLQVRPQPTLLYARGNLDLLRMPMVAIVGSRHPTNYGRNYAFNIARTCARAGVVVVSGFAAGLDGQAHRGALAGGGLTIAVLGCGLDFPYPPANADIRDEIASRGLFLTEYAHRVPSRNKWQFPARNRIIAGLAKVLVVVEGRIAGGTANTVEAMTKLGKTVLAVPGRLDEEMSAGPNLMIQQGAAIYLSPRDVLHHFGLAAPPDDGQRRHAPSAAARAELSGAEATLFDIITPKAVHVDELANRTKLDPGLLLAALSGLELHGLIRQLPGKHFALAS